MSLEQETAPLRMSKGQRSYNGLTVLAGTIQEECNGDLQWPDCMETYKRMFKDATISPALNIMEMDIAKVPWSIKIPDGYEEQLGDKAEFLKSVMHDMTHTWNDFIRQSATISRYGFAPVEKVYRKRTKANGSKYNDGLYGLKDLPLISQDTVKSWEFSADGRELTGLKQRVNIPTSEGNPAIFRQEAVSIPREKFILFRADPQKNSPIGTSPLNAVYVAWRFKTELEKFESTGVSQDLRGLKVIGVPPQYLSEEASPEDKATGEAFKEILRSLHSGEQSGVLMPLAYDENDNPLFSFELKSVVGQATHDVNTIIGRYRKEIITGILCPQLIIGQDGSGSFALAESLEGITKTVVNSRLTEIRDQLNHDLIPQLFEVNGWDTEVLPTFEFADIDEVSIDDLSKAIQRIASVGLISPSASMINWIHEKLGAPVAFEDTDIEMEDVREMLTGYDSNAAEGMESGSGNGTSNSASGRDNSSANTEN